VSDGSQLGWCESVYRAKATDLLLYGRALGLSHSEAEDVLHETFSALLERTEAPNQPEHFCVRSFRNRALNYRRSLWRRITREFESLRWFEQQPVETDNERAAMRCLSELPPDQREVIVLKIWHEHTFEEIGELLDLSPNTVAGRYRYGLQKLKACLKGSFNEESNTIDRPERSERIGKPIALVVASSPLGES
jgi:RNA polymerase sigma-70 factor (ECF subfamily)